MNSLHNIISDFRISGLLPLDLETIDYSKLNSKISYLPTSPSNGTAIVNREKSLKKVFMIMMGPYTDRSFKLNPNNENCSWQRFSIPFQRGNFEHYFATKKFSFLQILEKSFETLKLRN